MKIFFFALLFLAQAAQAEIPEAFHPIVVKPPFSFTERVFDLTPAFAKAKAKNMPLLIYLGAADCPPCKDYTRFLETHEKELVPVFAKFVVVDIRTWLRGGKLVFQIGEHKYSDIEFKNLIGDVKHDRFYPDWWLLTPEARQVRQLPSGSSNFLDVKNHIRLLEGS